MNKINRYKEIAAQLMERGSGIESIDEYVEQKLSANNKYWIVVTLIAIAIIASATAWC